MTDPEHSGGIVQRAVAGEITGRTGPIRRGPPVLKRKKPTTLELLRAVGWMPIVGMGIIVAGVVCCVALGATELAALLVGVICPNPLTTLQRKGDR